MRDLELALKAAGDPTRTRILKLLEGGGLCVCQVQAILGLAPSTVSKHLAILRLAGLVEDRREGKWIEYALPRDERNRYAKALLAMLRGSLERDPTIIDDRRRLGEVRGVPREQVCSAFPPRAPAPSGARPRARRGRERARA
jgi:arsenate reductase/ArsR family transcriptional regulator